MPLSEELKTKLAGKHILVDTCVLDAIRLHIKNSETQDFLNHLESINCPLVVHDFVKSEYLRDANKQSELITRKQLIDVLCKNFSLSFTQQMYQDAMVLSYIYVKHQHKGVELVDLMTSVILKNYAHSGSLALVTKNHHDFPLIVHDRLGTLVLDHGKELVTLGFYTIDLVRWNKEVSDLLTSGQWNS